MSPEMIDKFDALVKTLEKKLGTTENATAESLFPDARLSQDTLLNELVVSMLLWEASAAHAAKAIERINEELVGLNELRVCLPEELSTIIGVRMPRSLERAQRLIAVLNEIYDRENALTLAKLREMNKRDAQEYLSSIDGLPPYAAARVILFGMDWHAFPLDERLAKMLSVEGVITPGDPVEQQNAQLERGVRASDSARAYSLIERWAQNQRVGSRSSGSRAQTGSVKGATS